MNDEYKLKREKNNQSVKKCRENEKRKVEEATEKLEEYKKENKALEEKYSSLQKELSVLKSLFTQSTATVPSNSEDNQPSTNESTNSNILKQNEVGSTAEDLFNQ